MFENNYMCLFQKQIKEIFGSSTDRNLIIFRWFFRLFYIGLFLTGFGTTLQVLVRPYLNQTIISQLIHLLIGLFLMFTPIIFAGFKNSVLDAVMPGSNLEDGGESEYLEENTIEEIQTPDSESDSEGLGESGVILNFRETEDQILERIDNKRKEFDRKFKDDWVYERIKQITEQNFSGLKSSKLPDLFISYVKPATTPRRSGSKVFSFILKSPIASYFSEQKQKDRVLNTFEQSLSKVSDDIIWRGTVDSVKDTATFTNKDAFWTVTRPLDHEVVLATDIEQAINLYPKARFCIGIDEDGNPVSANPSRTPHMVNVGGTGSGKSFLSQGELEILRIEGWRVLIGDGGGSDYTLYSQTGGETRFKNNVGYIASRVGDIIRLVLWLDEETTRRRKENEEHKKYAGQDHIPQLYPILLLIDEFALVQETMKSTFSKEVYQMFFLKLASIFRVGRKYRIHVLISTQDIRAEYFPSTMKDNSSFTVLGKLTPYLITNGFKTVDKQQLKRIGERISGKKPGRGVAEVPDENNRPVAKEIQTYLIYSPAVPQKEWVPGTEEDWVSFQTEFSDRVLDLYTSQAKTDALFSSSRQENAKIKIFNKSLSDYVSEINPDFQVWKTTKVTAINIRRKSWSNLNELAKTEAYIEESDFSVEDSDFSDEQILDKSVFSISKDYDVQELE